MNRDLKDNVETHDANQKKLREYMRQRGYMNPKTQANERRVSATGRGFREARVLRYCSWRLVSGAAYQRKTLDSNIKRSFSWSPSEHLAEGLGTGLPSTATSNEKSGKISRS